MAKARPDFPTAKKPQVYPVRSQDPCDVLASVAHHTLMSLYVSALPHRPHLAARASRLANDVVLLCGRTDGEIEELFG